MTLPPEGRKDAAAADTPQHVNESDLDQNRLLGPYRRPGDLRDTAPNVTSVAFVPVAPA
jgi:hypothetical protein